jgi:dCMP deaminase
MAKIPSKIQFMRQACLLCDKSQCLYRVGCVAVRDGKVIMEAFNETLPGEKYCQEGECIRKKLGLTGGASIDKVCTIHAEVNLIAKAAARGVKLEDSDIYLTTFPCYICSKSLVQAKIGRLFYMSNYANNDGLRFFDAANIPVEQIEEDKVWKEHQNL